MNSDKRRLPLIREDLDELSGDCSSDVENPGEHPEVSSNTHRNRTKKLPPSSMFFAKSVRRGLIGLGVL